jgi:hypothetical protein
MNKFNTIEEYINDKIKTTFCKSFYPSAILTHVDGSTCESIYNVCEKYISENKLQEIYEIRCLDCADILGVYEHYADIPEVSECLKCGEDVRRMNNAIILYKIIR